MCYYAKFDRCWNLVKWYEHTCGDPSEKKSAPLVPAFKVTQHHRVSRVERLPVTSCLLSVVTTGNLVSEINGNFGRKRKIFPPRVFNAPAEGPLGMLQR